MAEVTNFIADQLKEMGFPEEKVRKAMAATKATSLETAMEWIIAHADDDDQPREEVAAAESSDGTLKLRPAAGGQADASESSDGTLKLRPAASAQAAEPVVPKTEEEIAEEKRRYEELIKQRRVEREEKERLEELEREMSRRKSGNEMVKLREKVQMDERIREAEERKREKEADKLHKQKVLDGIKRDREAFNARKAAEIAGLSNVQPAQSVNPVQMAPSNPISYDETRLAIRLPDGSQLVNTFKAKEQLAAVRLYIELNRKDNLSPEQSKSNFTLLMPPSTPFKEEDSEVPLDKLGLCPSARLVVSQRK
ncbi:UBX domain-containing protein 1 [Halotydeus destructor]|nr:UBX domain-containing protein 1 [Halotydeus destructor]